PASVTRASTMMRSTVTCSWTWPERVVARRRNATVRMRGISSRMFESFHIVKPVAIDSGDVRIDGRKSRLLVVDRGGDVHAVMEWVRRQMQHGIVSSVVGIFRKDADLDRFIEGKAFVVAEFVRH